jgi:putative hemolysin
MTAFDLFSKMQKSRIQMAIVLDPDGEMDGVVTLEDLVEEIVGEIEDEGIRVSPPIAKAELVVTGDTRLHDIEKELGESLVGSERFGSVAAYIHYQLRRLPIKGDVIITGRIKIEVREISDNHKMHKIIIKRI